MPRHSSWARFRGQNGSNAETLQTEGRKLLGEVMQGVDQGGPRVIKRSRWLPDGTLIQASYNGSVPVVTSFPPPQQLEEDEVTVNIWIPQGIIVTPATTAAPIGFGLPAAVEDEDTDPLDPGTAVGNWTIGGPCGQVLMTKAPNAGYPDDPDTSPPPLYWDEWEAPTDDVELVAQTDAWTAYRIRFRDLGASYTAILAEINDRRTGDKPLCPPFFGYEDMAVEFRNLNGAFAPADYPIGAATLLRRIEKDGTCAVLSSTNADGELGSGTMPAGLTVDQIVDELETAAPHITDGTYDVGTSFSLVGGTAFTTALLNHRENWVRCGNIDWQSIHDEVPRLSWTGPQGRSIPPHELAFGLKRYDHTHVGQAIYLDDLSTEFQDATVKVFDRCIYARGRLLAVLPNDGFVLGAAIQRVPATLDNPVTYRLIAIAWHRADQFFQSGDSGYVKVWDTTSDVRVWTADLFTRKGLACAPEYVVSGVYDETTNPRGWTDRARHRLWPFGSFDHGPGYYLSALLDPGIYASEAERCSPKTYWQPWFFNGSGTRAVCLRGSAYASVSDPRNIGTLGAVQALAIDVDAGGSTSIGLEWELDEPTAILFTPFLTEPMNYAWDFAGDDVRRAWLTLDPDTGIFGTTHAETTTGSSIIATELTGDTEPDFAMGTLWYFDARTDSYIAAVQQISTPGLSYYHVDSVAIRFGIDGIDVDSVSAAGPATYTLGFSGLGMTGATTNWCNRDEFASAYPNHPRVMVAFARYGADYAAGVWWGAHPGDLLGDPDDGIEGSAYVNAAYLASYSTVDPAPTPTDWFNFAGVA